MVYSGVSDWQQLMRIFFSSQGHSRTNTQRISTWKHQCQCFQSVPITTYHQQKDCDEDMAADRCPGPYPCLCLCFMGQEPSVSKARRGEEGMLGGLGMRMWEGGQGKTGSQLSALCTDIWLSVLVALCEKTKGPPSPSSQRDTPFEKPLTVCRSSHMYMRAYTHTGQCAHFQICMIQPQSYTYIQVCRQKHTQSTFTSRHTHLLHFAQVTLFIIQSIFLGMWCAHREATCTFSKQGTP